VDDVSNIGGARQARCSQSLARSYRNLFLFPLAHLGRKDIRRATLATRAIALVLHASRALVTTHANRIDEGKTVPGLLCCPVGRGG